jgi:hypothetical protein
MIRHATEQPKPLKASNPAVPDGLQQIVNWMLAKDPGQRYPTPERAAQAMQMFLAAGAESITPEADPKMKKYLTFLEIDTAETEKKAKDAAAAHAKPGTAVAGTSAAATGKESAKQRNPDPQRKHAMSKRERKRARKSAAALTLGGDKAHPAPKTASPAPPVFDVELVALPGVPGAPGGKTLSLPLTRRDLAMFLFGVGTVVIGVLITVGIMASLGMFSRKEPISDDKD